MAGKLFIYLTELKIIYSVEQEEEVTSTRPTAAPLYRSPKYF